MKLRIHVAMCHLCSAFGRDVSDLQRIAAMAAANAEVDESTMALTPEVKDRLRRLLKETHSHE